MDKYSKQEKEEFKKKYDKYITSVEWAKVRGDLIAIYGCCQNCGNKYGLQAHHLTYKNLFFEEPEDLLLLCKKCHLTEHGLYKPPKRRRKKKRKQRKIKQKVEKKRFKPRYIIRKKS